MLIDRCVCGNVTFVEMLDVARASGVHSLPELQQYLPIGLGCGLCRPYIKAALQSGQVTFTDLLPDDENEEDSA